MLSVKEKKKKYGFVRPFIQKDLNLFLENSHLENTLWTDLLSDQMRAGSWLEVLNSLGLDFFYFCFI